MADPTPAPEVPTDISQMTPAQATAKLEAMAKELYRGPAPPANSPTAAAAQLAALESDKDWRDKFLSGDLAAARQREALQKLAGDEQQQPPGFIETVDAVSDKYAVTRERYETLLDAARDQGLPATAESYIRDFDAGLRQDRPTEGDGIACRQALDRLMRDPTFRSNVLNGDIAANNLLNVLNRVIAFAAPEDGQPVSDNTVAALARLGLR